jgi:hypothetical protein
MKMLPVVLLGLGSFGLMQTLSAATCASTSNCTFVFTTANTSSGFSSGSDFGTVNLALQGETIKFSIDLSSSGLKIWDQQASFPGAFGFNDNNSSDTLTIGSYSSSAYSGSGTNGSYPQFGTFDDIAGVSGPGQQMNGASLVSALSFVVSTNQVGGFTDVNQLVQLTGSDYFVAHAFCASSTCGGAGKTGAVAATKVETAVTPEPASYLVLLSAGFGVMLLAIESRRRRSGSDAS